MSEKINEDRTSGTGTTTVTAFLMSSASHSFWSSSLTSLSLPMWKTHTSYIKQIPTIQLHDLEIHSTHFY